MVFEDVAWRDRFLRTEQSTDMDKTAELRFEASVRHSDAEVQCSVGWDLEVRGETELGL